MTKDEALKLALEALEVASSCVDGYYIPKGKTQLPEVESAITAIREALAQPEQEPHSWYSKQEDEWMTHKTRMEHEQLNSYTHKVGKFDLALYTTPPQRKPLTDEEIDAIYAGVRAVHHEIDSYVFARAIEAALKEKNQ